jgi:hypothetical protein
MILWKMQELTPTTMETITSLRDIPLAVFHEFAITDDPAKQTFTEDGHKTVVRACFAQRTGPNGPHTLVHHEYTDSYEKRYSTQLEVYNYPVQTAEFNPKSDWFKPEPVMTILFCAQDFDTEEPPFGTPWKEGGGYWIQEYLKVFYGNGSRCSVNMISNQNDWEFKFFLDIQNFAYELAHKVSTRGHWQSEWNPRGDYSGKSKSLH